MSQSKTWLYTATVLSCFFLAPLTARIPAWWTEQNVLLPGSDPLAPANTLPVANLGQARHLALAAWRAMEARAPGSAGPAITSMVAALDTDTPANFSPLQIGRLKALSAPFFDRFAETGFALPGHLVLNSVGYPWGEPPSPESSALAPANLGQLKYVFSFDLEGWPPRPPDPERDTDGDGLPDIWEIANGLNFIDPADANSDPDQDGLSNFGEFHYQGDPHLPDTDADGRWDSTEAQAGTDLQTPDHPAVGLVVHTRLN